MIIPPSCSTCSDGKIVVSVKGPYRPYYFSIDGGQTWHPPDYFGGTTKTFSGLAPGVYDVLVTADRCPTDMNFTCLLHEVVWLRPEEKKSDGCCVPVEACGRCAVPPCCGPVWYVPYRAVEGKAFFSFWSSGDVPAQVYVLGPCCDEDRLLEAPLGAYSRSVVTYGDRVYTVVSGEVEVGALSDDEEEGRCFRLRVEMGGRHYYSGVYFENRGRSLSCGGRSYTVYDYPQVEVRAEKVGDDVLGFFYGTGDVASRTLSLMGTLELVGLEAEDCVSRGQGFFTEDVLYLRVRRRYRLLICGVDEYTAQHLFSLIARGPFQVDMAFPLSTPFLDHYYGGDDGVLSIRGLRFTGHLSRSEDIVLCGRQLWRVEIEAEKEEYVPSTTCCNIPLEEVEFSLTVPPQDTRHIPASFSLVWGDGEAPCGDGTTPVATLVFPQPSPDVVAVIGALARWLEEEWSAQVVVDTHTLYVRVERDALSWVRDPLCGATLYLCEYDYTGRRQLYVVSTPVRCCLSYRPQRDLYHAEVDTNIQVKVEPCSPDVNTAVNVAPCSPDVNTVVNVAPCSPAINVAPNINFTPTIQVEPAQVNFPDQMAVVNASDSWFRVAMMSNFRKGSECCDGCPPDYVAFPVALPTALTTTLFSSSASPTYEIRVGSQTLLRIPASDMQYFFLFSYGLSAAAAVPYYYMLLDYINSFVIMSGVWAVANVPSSSPDYVLGVVYVSRKLAEPVIGTHCSGTVTSRLLLGEAVLFSYDATYACCPQSEGGDTVLQWTVGQGVPTTPPSTPFPSFYVDTQTHTAYYYSTVTNSWVPIGTVGGGATQWSSSSSAPTAPPSSPGLHYHHNTDTNEVYRWTGTHWVLVGKWCPDCGGGVQQWFTAPGGPVHPPSGPGPHFFYNFLTKEVFRWDGVQWIRVAVWCDSCNEWTSSTTNPSSPPANNLHRYHYNSQTKLPYYWDGDSWEPMDRTPCCPCDVYLARDYIHTLQMNYAGMFTGYTPCTLVDCSQVDKSSFDLQWSPDLELCWIREVSERSQTPGLCQPFFHFVVQGGIRYYYGYVAFHPRVVCARGFIIFYVRPVQSCTPLVFAGPLRQHVFVHNTVGDILANRWVTMKSTHPLYSQFNIYPYLFIDPYNFFDFLLGNEYRYIGTVTELSYSAVHDFGEVFGVDNYGPSAYSMYALCQGCPQEDRFGDRMRPYNPCDF